MVPDLGSLTGFQLALFSSLAAGLATGLGALPGLLVGGRPSPRMESWLLGSAAGVMLAACFTSLLGPSLELVTAAGGGAARAIWVVAGGALLGALAVQVLHRWTPHEHFHKGPEGADPRALERRWLFVFAIALHNLPEGLAVGVGAATGDLGVSLPLTLGIGLQNLPEGFIVAATLRSLGYSRRTAFAVALGTGLLEPVGGVLGYALVSAAEVFLPLGLALAAGAMLWVVAGEVIPESHGLGRADHATWGLVVGAALMVLLDGAIQ